MLRAEIHEAGYAAGRAIVRDVELTVEPGALVALLGVNGAGKTTALRGVLNALPLRRADVSVDGADASAWPPERFLRAGVAMVPEGRGVLAGLTVRENLRMGGYIVKPRAEVDRRIEEALEIFDRLRPRIDANAAVLSGGEQQMLAVARALISRPRYLLLDEPSMGLAPNIVHMLMRVVRGLVDDGMGVLLVEQNARAALRVADTAHVLERGQISLSGPAAQLRDDAVVQRTYLGVGA
jgi:branched-chain amino acid transport system ATP-binding protein